jgi:hypothetical protein
MTVADELPITAALCPSWATGVGYMGVAAAVVLSNWGSAVRTIFLVIKNSMVGLCSHTLNVSSCRDHVPSCHNITYFVGNHPF